MSDHILGLIIPGMMLVFAAGAVFLWQRDRTHTYLLGYGVAPLLLGFSFIINHYLVTPDGSAARIASGLCSIAAVGTMAWAACQRLNLVTPVRLWVAGAIVPLAVMMLSDPLRDVTPWLLAVNGYCGLIFVMAAQLMAIRRPEPLVDRILIWVFAIIAAQFFIRPIAVIMLEGDLTSIGYRENVGHAIFVATAAILTLVLTGSILATIVADQFKSIRESAKVDELSGLKMRDAFETEAGDILRRAEETSKPVCLIIADLDYFKQVNDLWGHPAGDAVIKAFGEVIVRTIRPNDCAGRVGGEEFCVLAWDCPEAGGVTLAERLRRGIAQVQHDSIRPEMRLTASFGVAQWQPGETLRSAYGRADEALYKAKRTGRDKVVAHRGIHENPEQDEPASHRATGQPRVA